MEGGRVVAVAASWASGALTGDSGLAMAGGGREGGEGGGEDWGCAEDGKEAPKG